MADPRIEHEAFLQCPGCHGKPYRLYRRQNINPDGSLKQSFQHVLWPTEAGVSPPLDHRHIKCPKCDEELRRVP